MAVKETDELPYNDQKRAEALTRKILRQQAWRSKTWAECELRIETMQAELVQLGIERVELPEHDFADPATLAQLANSTIGDE